MWSAPKSEETASPSRPPSPAGETPGTDPSSVFFPESAETLKIFPVSREDTSRSPPGSGATPQGDFSLVVSVLTTFTEPFLGAADSLAHGADDGDRKSGGRERV